jgi:hypothetical protein
MKAHAKHPVHPAEPLSGSHLRTYQTIFQHPISHNLGWHEVHALFRKLGQVEDEPNGNLKVTRNGQTLVLHPPKSKDVSETAEVMSLRHFLERSELAPVEAAETATDWLLVIDHHQARLFRAGLQDTTPEQILPHEPDDFFRHTQDSLESARGKEKPDPKTFFAPIAQALHAAGRLLIFGTGTGTSSEMDQFVAWTNVDQPELAARIIGTVVVDEHHLTEGQLLAKAREFYAALPVPASDEESPTAPA